MKVSLAILLLLNYFDSTETNAIQLNRAGFIDCEVTGSCSKTVKKSPNGFVGNVDLNQLYGFSELDNSAREVAEAKQILE